VHTKVSGLMSQAKVYCKTAAGLEEVQHRHAGLNARVRQLLILVDGKRSVGELSRMMAMAEFEEFLDVLELKGLIQVRHSGVMSEVSSAEVRPSETIVVADPDSVAAVEFPEPGVSVSRQYDDSVALARHPLTSNEIAQRRAPETVRLERDRVNIAKLLQESVGPLADDLCNRIGRAAKPAELSELFVASLTVVELMSGRKAADRFVEKMKQMGWEG
jgi:hypothetical protein